MTYLIIYTIIIQAIGGILFFNLLDGQKDVQLTKTIMKTNRYVRCFVLFLWPFFIMGWFITNK